MACSLASTWALACASSCSTSKRFSRSDSSSKRMSATGSSEVAICAVKVSIRSWLRFTCDDIRSIVSRVDCNCDCNVCCRSARAWAVSLSCRDFSRDSCCERICCSRLCSSSSRASIFSSIESSATWSRCRDSAIFSCSSSIWRLSSSSSWWILWRRSPASSTFACCALNCDLRLPNALLLLAISSWSCSRACSASAMASLSSAWRSFSLFDSTRRASIDSFNSSISPRLFTIEPSLSAVFNWIHDLPIHNPSNVTIDSCEPKACLCASASASDSAA